jgi:hypothetical protein
MHLRDEDSSSPGSADNEKRYTRPLLSDSRSPNRVHIQSANESDLNDSSVIIRDSFGTAPKPPKDTYQIAYFVVLLFGIANLLPWNIIICASKDVRHIFKYAIF